MRAAAHDTKFAKRLGIPQSVAREFVAGDKKRGKKKLARLPESKS
jgi:hypothetical protein